MRAALAAVAIVLATLAIGCNRPRSRLPVLVVGPMRGGASIATFQRVVQSARAQGYETLYVEPRFGSFAVTSRTGTPGVTFEVQCFGDGRVQVRVAGVDRSPSTGIVMVTSSLQIEAVRFAETLEAGGGGGIQ